jgi:hypothetical protein
MQTALQSSPSAAKTAAAASYQVLPAHNDEHMKRHNDWQLSAAARLLRRALHDLFHFNSRAGKKHKRKNSARACCTSPPTCCRLLHVCCSAQMPLQLALLQLHL